jgi:UDP-N-acetylmuramyl tripeptide synthase
VNTTPESLELQRHAAGHAHGASMPSRWKSRRTRSRSAHRRRRFEAAAFTNVTQEHLDFHETMDAYRVAKTRLFREHLRPGAAAVLNLDDPAAAEFLAAARDGGGRPICVARKPGPGVDVAVEAAHVDLGGTRARLRLPSGPLELALPLLGDFNVENLLVAVGVAVGRHSGRCHRARCGVVPASARRIERVIRPPRHPPCSSTTHTPDAVDKLLRTVRPMASGRLITVFGCGGDRDRTKRADGEAVALGDRAIATSDTRAEKIPRRSSPTSYSACGACARSSLPTSTAPTRPLRAWSIGARPFSSHWASRAAPTPW